ncbi:hypothetical protein AX17_006399 [Amanita inopinata Kibby_2008]|nr:hypothetical protein AX17_006399 [Amanita inopinata Kibby_2008]
MTTATLRSLYNRATRAFVHRDIALTHSLVESAFTILQPPPALPDPLTDFRRKWDILRITLDTVTYTTPSPPGTVIPDPLKQNALESPQALLTSMFTRSLTLFTPADGTCERVVLNAAYLPSQVLLTLVYSSIKVNAHESGQYMIEEWLARRDPLSLPETQPTGATENDGYEKVVDIYCLHILPKLEHWHYAREFLEHETELAENVRQNIKLSLNSLHTQALAAHKPPRERQFLNSSTSASNFGRSSSPTPSSCSSSSLSTTSTHTITPSKPNGGRNLNSVSAITPLASASASSTSLSSDTTATPHGYSSTRKSRHSNRNHDHHSPKSNFAAQPNGSKLNGTNRSSSSTSHSSSPWSSFPFSSHSQATSLDSSNPSTYALVKANLASYLTLPKISTLIIIFVLFPVISFILRIRHKRRKLLAGGGASASHIRSIGGSVTPLKNNVNGHALTNSNADLVRRRLGGDATFVGKIWSEMLRMVTDTVKMAGSGLV